MDLVSGGGALLTPSAQARTRVRDLGPRTCIQPRTRVRYRALQSYRGKYMLVLFRCFVPLACMLPWDVRESCMTPPTIPLEPMGIEIGVTPYDTRHSLATHYSVFTAIVFSQFMCY